MINIAMAGEDKVERGLMASLLCALNMLAEFCDRRLELCHLGGTHHRSELGIGLLAPAIESSKQEDILVGCHRAKERVVASAIIIGVLKIRAIEARATVIGHDEREGFALRASRASSEDEYQTRNGHDQTG